jgi:hypothetical protein
VAAVTSDVVELDHFMPMYSFGKKLPMLKIHLFTKFASHRFDNVE